MMRLLNHNSKTSTRRRFTLVEMLVAMAVLVILMLMLFRVLAGAQQAWALTKTNTRIYENARIALDLIQRDLRCMAVSDQPGREIPYSIVDDDGNVERFVSASSLISSTTASKLCEIAYSTAGNNLQRTSVNSSSGSSWDFASDTTNAWLSGGGAQTVIGGVESVSIVFYDDAGPLATGVYTTPPMYAQISITVFDEDLAGLPDWQDRADKTKRTFTKIMTFSQ